MIAEKPNVAQPHYLCGRVAALSGDNLERGERELRIYLAQSPDAPPPSQSAAHLRLGMIYERQAKKDLAKGEYRTAVTLNPQSEAKQRLDAIGRN